MRRFRTALAGLAIVVAVPTAGLPATGADPLLPKQWGLHRVGAPAAWATTTGTGALIAVVDTGVDYTHEDLKGKVEVRRGSNLWCAGGPCEDDPRDDNGHGSHVAGVAAATANNGKGVAGVAPGAKVLAVKVLDHNGGALADEVAVAVRYAADQGADVINLSLGLNPGVDLIPGVATNLHESVAYAWSKGAVIVAAAGNLTVPLCSSPAVHELALCVGAVDRQDRVAYYSQSGVGLDIAAPGGAEAMPLEPPDDVFWTVCDADTDIWSTYPHYLRSPLCLDGTFAPYRALAGTSMAAPFVTGAAALLAAQGLTNQQIVACLLATADDLGAPGADPLTGAGIVNAARAVSSC